MQAWGRGVEAQLLSFLTSALDDQRHAPVALRQGNRSGAQRIGSWVGPRADLER